jgi:hypothetical protein
MTAMTTTAKLLAVWRSRAIELVMMLASDGPQISPKVK